MNSIERNKTDEQKFLASYDITKYDRPSVTTDIAVFSMSTKEAKCHRRDGEQNLSVLLVKRGEHPYKGMWALPGGFLRADETLEECAERELLEETSLKPVSMMQIGVFSMIDRDPRGRIISNAYASIVTEEDAKVAGGSDASVAKWFSIEFTQIDTGEFNLVLESEEDKMSASLRVVKSLFSNTEFEIVSCEGIAFDHAKIIGTALFRLRKESENQDLAFDFLPEKFTLASLQKVQEILSGSPLLTANFRRKVADLVLETDEYTESIGHRPAKLFRRRTDNK